MRIPSLSKLGCGALVFIVASAIAAPLPFRMERVSSITEDQAKIVLGAFRRSIEGDLKELPSELKSISNERVPFVLTAWRKGLRNRIYQVDGEPLGEAFTMLQAKLKKLGGRFLKDPRLRLQLDFVTEKGWTPDGGLLASLAFVEGHHGISGVISNERVYLAPSEMIRNKKYGSFRPLPGYDKKFKVGVDVEKLKRSIEYQGRQVDIEGDGVSDLERFVSLSVVEGEDLKPKRLLKATVERAEVTRWRVKASVLAGARYLKRSLKPSGVFHYHYNPVRDRDEGGTYNWPRHAGVSYSLALVGRLLEDRESIETAKRALERFEKQLTDGPDGSKCLMAKGKCYLGSSALGLLALAEYRIASSDDSFDEMAKKVALFIKAMRKPGELFYHDWYPEKGIDKELMKLYASAQAVFALARYAKAFDDKAALKMASKGMDYLAGPYWDHFLGSYFFGLEHWTCLAAEEVYREIPKPEYADLCYGIGTHYNNTTHKPGQTPFIEDVGGMSITHLFTPHVGGTATAIEAMVSAVILGNAVGKDTASFREQLKASYGYFIKTQITAHDTFWIRKAAYSVGGFFETQSKTKVRIDNVQHTISAMVRGMKFIEDSSEPSNIMKEYEVSPSIVNYPY